MSVVLSMVDCVGDGIISLQGSSLQVHNIAVIKIDHY